MFGYKGFDKNLKCRGFQYEIGKTFEEDVEPKCCERGLHFCELPLDVLNYYNYSPINGSRFAKVEALGTIDKREDKVATNKLRVDSELTFWDLFKLQFKLVFEKVETSTTKVSTSGNYAHSSTSGYKAHSSTSGYKAHSSTSGYEAHSSTSGYKAHSSTSGDEAHSSTSGDEAHSSTSGNYAHSSTSGNEAISSSLGLKARAKANKGWIIVVDWQQDENYNWYINEIYHSKVGGKILDTEIKSNTWYWFENGKLESLSEDK